MSSFVTTTLNSSSSSGTVLTFNVRWPWTPPGAAGPDPAGVPARIPPAPGSPPAAIALDLANVR